MSKPLRIVIHVLLFLAALAVFWVGIVFGLTVNPNLGTTLWIVAIAIAGLNVLWIVLSARKARAT